MSQDTTTILNLIASFAGCIANIIMSGTTIYLAYLALKGLDQWRANLRAQTKYDVALAVLRQANRFQTAFYQTRNLFTRVGEAADRPKFENENEWDHTFLDERYARLTRFEVLSSSFDDLRTVKTEAEILLDEKVSSAIEQIESLFFTLKKAFNVYFDVPLYKIGERDDRILEKRESYHDIVYGYLDDDLNKQCDAAVLAVKEAIKGYMKVQ